MMGTPLRLVLVLVAVTATAATSECPAPKLKLTGNVTLVAILDGHSGDDCAESDARGLQEMATVAWLVNALNHAHFLPGRKIGLTLFDGCSSTVTSQRALLSALNDHGCDSDADHMGLLVSPRTAGRLHALTAPLHLRAHSTAGALLESPLPEAAAALLAALSLRTVDHVLLPGAALLTPLGAAARAHGVCLLQVHVGGDPREVSLNGVVLAVGSASQLAVIGNLSAATSGAGVHLVMVALGDVDDQVKSQLPARSVLLTSNPVTLRPPAASTPAAWASVGRQLFIDVAAAALASVATPPCAHGAGACNRVMPLRTLADKLGMRTGDNGVFYTAWRKQDDNSMEAFAEFRLSAPTADRMLALTSLKNVTLSTAAATTSCDFRITNSTDNDFRCRKCVNRRLDDDDVGFEERFAFRTLAFRSEPWAAALASVVAVGALSTLAVGAFISVRCCKGDVLEGSPCLSFLLLAAILLTYLAVAPFSIAPPFVDGILCHVRLAAPAAAYALTFSVMLARSLMLASCDDEGGFLSHVNGYLQATLCFFALAVQAALTLQFVLLDVDLSSERCAFFSSGLPFLATLSYDGFLLAVLLCTTPFTARSKRNYREGAFFTAGVLVVAGVWACWIGAFIWLGAEDAVVAAGLTGTASAVLLCVFIPRTYLMASAVARDNLANALPALAYSANSVVDLNYRTASTQALYATVAPRQGVANPNYYAAPTAVAEGVSQARAKAKAPKGKAGSDNGTDSTYEHYDEPPSPPKVTRF